MRSMCAFQKINSRLAVEKYPEKNAALSAH